ncbi:hypothetical protein BDB01DRAFT_797321 [Pilobolus umbonatus]|nr:hypothetical protein BDB01DRAFT_797321 [Pilobolus umbonatus]
MLSEIPPYTTTQGRNLTNSYERLSREIIDFTYFVRPTPIEQDHKKRTLEYIGEIITSSFKQVVIQPFGSYVTGLQFPYSDIDINISVENNQSPPSCILGSLSQILKGETYSSQIHGVWFIDKAKIRVIKVSMVDGIEVDITYNNDTRSSKRTEEWLAQYPDLKPLFMVLKFALSHIRVDGQRNFSCISAAHGGMASFTFICLIVSFLQLRAESVPGINDNNRYAMLLLNFLEYYSTFKTTVHGISLKREGALVKPRKITEKSVQQRIYIENPDRSTKWRSK